MLGQKMMVLVAAVHRINQQGAMQSKQTQYSTVLYNTIQLSSERTLNMFILI